MADDEDISLGVFEFKGDIFGIVIGRQAMMFAGVDVEVLGDALRGLPGAKLGAVPNFRRNHFPRSKRLRERVYGLEPLVGQGSLRVDVRRYRITVTNEV